MAFSVAPMVKNLPAVWETWVWSLGGKIPWRKNGYPPSILAWRIPWTEEPGRATVHGVAKSWTQLSDFHFHFSLWIGRLLSFPLNVLSNMSCCFTFSTILKWEFLNLVVLSYNTNYLLLLNIRALLSLIFLGYSGEGKHSRMIQRKPHDVHAFARSWNFVILSYIQGLTYFSKEEQFSLSLQCKKSGQNTDNLTWIRTFRWEEVVKALASQEIKQATQLDGASRTTDLS